jgi:D-tyrosyl-tRNA(Tyr) deacylase
MVVQRVSWARVVVGGHVAGEIGPGLCVLLGVRRGDGEDQAAWLSEKLVNLRIFEDGEGKLNRSLLDVEGEALIVSQFTLCGDCRKGRRPSFVEAAPGEEAEPLYEDFIRRVEILGVRCARGVFGADMSVELANDGPVTLILEGPGAVGA